MNPPQDPAPEEPDFKADIRRHVDNHLIPKYTNNMPFHLIDTYTGLILERYEIVTLLQLRKDYRAKIDAVISEAETLATLIDPECPTIERPVLSDFQAFVAEFLAFAMFSHRWRGGEPSLDDVRGAQFGIYAMTNDDVAKETPKSLRLPERAATELFSGVEKLQEFCCVAAKCGYRWAWSDTCCINKKDYAETSESINSMFLWYRSSDLTIVYLDDVDDVKEGRFEVEEADTAWFDDREIKEPLPATNVSTQTSAGIYAEPLETASHLPLHRRLSDKYRRLQTMHPDTQIERLSLDTLLRDKFPHDNVSQVNGQYRQLPVWVTRGWTLQEMIASKRLRFYSKKWTLLEEAEDRDTDEAEAQISIASFKFRARLADHRANDMWARALTDTTGVNEDDLVNFKIGTRDVRTRLLWAAKRSTTKVEDMAYCLLGIFDVSLPALYGEGTRAFIRLQEELMKRTGDMSLFDWCGRSSSLNTFLAHQPECFEMPNLSKPIIDDSHESTFSMIMNLFLAIFGTVWSGIRAATHEAMTWIKNIMKAPPPGHALINGELNISLMEHSVKRCQRVPSPKANDPRCYYKVESDGLVPTTVVLPSPAPSLVNHPTQYYLCRTWNRHTQNVFQILLELMEYVLKDAFQHFWPKDDCESENGQGSDSESPVMVGDEEDTPDSKLREEMQIKRRAVMEFFQYPFPVYLVRVEDDRRVRVGTVTRAVSVYTRFDFTMPVVMRCIL